MKSWKCDTYNIPVHVCCTIFDVYGNCVFKFTSPYIPCSIFCIFVSRLCWVNIKSTQIHTIPVERGQIWTHWYCIYFFCRFCICVVNCTPRYCVHNKNCIKNTSFSFTSSNFTLYLSKTFHDSEIKTLDGLGNGNQWFWQNFIISMCGIKFWKVNESLWSGSAIDQWIWQNFIISMYGIKFWKGNENLKSIYKKPSFEILSSFFHLNGNDENHCAYVNGGTMF